MEYFKLIVDSATPIVLIIVGFKISRSLAQYRSGLAVNVKLIEKRIKLYDEVSCELNDIYQYMIRVGAWKEMTPKEIIGKKRIVDKLVYKNQPYWDKSFIEKYDLFISFCFKTNNGNGKDAKIKTNYEKYKVLDSWADKNRELFTGEYPDVKAIKNAYSEFNKVVSAGINPV